jgi:hypothetical protein
MTETNKLVFNGINGTTGKYGLPPMTCKTLAGHITGGAGQATGAQEFQSGLERNRAAKLSALVKLLAESALQDAPRDDAWRSQWFKTLARTLASELWADAYVTPARLKALERRLAQNPAQTLADLAALLAQSKPAELAELLRDPDEARDDPLLLTGQVLRDAGRSLEDIRKTLLDENRAAAWDGNPGAQRAWLEAFITALYLAPVPALSSLTRAQNPQIALIKALAPLSRVYSSMWLIALLDDLQAQPASLAWPDLLQVLRDGLEARIMAQDEAIPWREVFDALRTWLSAIGVSRRHVVESVDATDLAQAGWGIIFPTYTGPGALPPQALQEALAPLLDLRQSQADGLFRIYEGGAGYRPNDTAASFLLRHGATPSDPVDPKRVPYYLLLVGSPEDIPFHFQYQLDVQYAVGRIDFDDLADYAHYARSVVAAETGAIQRPPTAAFFGVANPGDTATAASAAHLVSPLAAQLQARYPAWQMNVTLREAATKSGLARLLGEDAPALLFTASHGLEFPPDAPAQRQRQGALLCQEWPGPHAWHGTIPPDFYLAGEDVSATANLTGLIAFFFACYSAGTPRLDEYTRATFKRSGAVLAERPFVAALPQALLSRPRGGALAVVGHVERAWGSSFLDTRRNEQIAVFTSALERLLKGQPLGLAMEYFNGRYAALSTELTATLDQYALSSAAENSYELARLWGANNDARGYIVLGDPAVRLPVAQMP